MRIEQSHHDAQPHNHFLSNQKKEKVKHFANANWKQAGLSALAGLITTFAIYWLKSSADRPSDTVKLEPPPNSLKTLQIPDSKSSNFTIIGTALVVILVYSAYAPTNEKLEKVRSLLRKSFKQVKNYRFNMENYLKNQNPEEKVTRPKLFDKSTVKVDYLKLLKSDNFTLLENTKSAYLKIDKEDSIKLVNKIRLDQIQIPLLREIHDAKASILNHYLIVYLEYAANATDPKMRKQISIVNLNTIKVTPKDVLIGAAHIQDDVLGIPLYSVKGKEKAPED